MALNSDLTRVGLTAYALRRVAGPIWWAVATLMIVQLLAFAFLISGMPAYMLR